MRRDARRDDETTFETRLARYSTKRGLCVEVSYYFLKESSKKSIKGDTPILESIVRYEGLVSTLPTTLGTHLSNSSTYIPPLGRYSKDVLHRQKVPIVQWASAEMQLALKNSK